MRKLSCKDAGSPDCNFEATGQNDDEVIAKGKEHVRAVHQHDLTRDEESKARSMIRNA
jgi:predicted small metal-binding protein